MNNILSYRNKKRIGRVLLYIGIVFMCFVSIFPYLWMVLVSLKDKVLIYQPGVWFFKPNFENYKIVDI